MANLMPTPKSGRPCKFYDMQRAEVPASIITTLPRKMHEVYKQEEETCFMGSLYFQ
ncbi:hypothetical protein L873DRAFT_1812823 [Choiromyces venosus 120613-1]|uniref:Uncharacterized protein n=1 Tax=Choiromyces venosus 120613-1 TaxID=1336337 RepID=A0A3N4JB35_9PEZI|nr:hypothetical protein L873DRAFT_1812823 [Choiromyces venosus 120613-1]